MRPKIKQLDGGSTAGHLITSASGAVSSLKHNLAATAAPAATDDSSSGYAVGSVWMDTTNDMSYVCVDATASNAVWLLSGYAPDLEGAATRSGIEQAFFEGNPVQPWVETSNTSPAIMATVPFAGKDVYTPTKFTAILNKSGQATTASVQIWDLTNVSEVALMSTAATSKTLVTMAIVAGNLPAAAAIFEIKIYATGGNGTRRAQLHYVSVR